MSNNIVARHLGLYYRPILLSHLSLHPFSHYTNREGKSILYLILRSSECTKLSTTPSPLHQAIINVMGLPLLYLPTDQRFRISCLKHDICKRWCKYVILLLNWSLFLFWISCLYAASLALSWLLDDSLLREVISDFLNPCKDYATFSFLYGVVQLLGAYQNPSNIPSWICVLVLKLVWSLCYIYWMLWYLLCYFIESGSLLLNATKFKCIFAVLNACLQYIKVLWSLLSSYFFPA